MAIEKGVTHIVDVEAGAAVPPEGHLLYARDTDKLYKSDGSTLTELSTGGGSYSDEQAQDAVGAMVDTTLVYTDATPLLSRAALTGDVTASSGSNATTVSNNVVTFAKMQDIATDSLIGRDTAASGDPENILLNSTLSMDGAGNLQRSALTGDVTASAGSNATTIANDSVSDAKLRNSSALSVIGRSANSSGDPADIAGATVGHVLQVLSGPTIGFGTGLRRPSWDNPPASPHSYDDEFDAGTLNAKWTIGSAGTTAAAVAGTIDHTASLTTPIVDVATVPGWLCFQSDNSSVGTMWIEQAYSPSTNATFFFKVAGNARSTNVNHEGNVWIRLINSGAANESIVFHHIKDGTNHSVALQVINAGVSTVVTPANKAGENTPIGPWYLVMWKKSNVYHAGFATSDGLFTYMDAGSVTKTGKTTFDKVQVGFSTANETPSIIDGVDFFRYKASLDYSLVNP